MSANQRVAMLPLHFINGTIILEDRLLTRGEVFVQGGRISGVGQGPSVLAVETRAIDLDGGYLAPGFVD